MRHGSISCFEEGGSRGAYYCPRAGGALRRWSRGEHGDPLVPPSRLRAGCVASRQRFPGHGLRNRVCGSDVLLRLIRTGCCWLFPLLFGRMATGDKADRVDPRACTMPLPRYALLHRASVYQQWASDGEQDISVREGATSRANRCP